MKRCPHCGAELRENARFCLACMTPLNEKRVIPTPKYVPVRWLSATAAVLVLVLAVWSAGQAFLTDPPPVTDTLGTTILSSATETTANTTVNTTVKTTVKTTVNTTVNTTAITTTLTTLAETFSTTTSTRGYTGSLPTYPSTTLPTYEVTSGRVPPFLTTTATLPPPTTTATTTTTQKPTTTTTQKPTTTTTRPYWYDATPAAVTEDGLPIEEVEWTYKQITVSAFTGTKDDGAYFSHGYYSVSETPSGIPVNQCIKVTGCSGVTSNGIYRVPAVIDGYVVAQVDLSSCFNQGSVAATVKRIYLPPDAVWFPGNLQNCSQLESVYVTSTKIVLDSKFPPKSHMITLYAQAGTYVHNIYDFSPPVLFYYCGDESDDYYRVNYESIQPTDVQQLYGNETA